MSNMFVHHLEDPSSPQALKLLQGVLAGADFNPPWDKQIEDKKELLVPVRPGINRAWGHYSPQIFISYTHVWVERPDWFKYHSNQKFIKLDGQVSIYHDGTGQFDTLDAWSDEPVIYHYILGCKHEMKEIAYERYVQLQTMNGRPSIPYFRCMHVYECQKCGHYYYVDSGD